jgi:hypothetical protein
MRCRPYAARVAWFCADGRHDHESDQLGVWLQANGVRDRKRGCVEASTDADEEAAGQSRACRSALEMLRDFFSYGRRAISGLASEGPRPSWAASKESVY